MGGVSASQRPSKRRSSPETVHDIDHSPKKIYPYNPCNFWYIYLHLVEIYGKLQVNVLDMDAMGYVFFQQDLQKTHSRRPLHRFFDMICKSP